MLCGWRQIDDKPRLVELGSGTLEIDALTGECTFNGAPIEPLGVASDLRHWLSEDLLAHHIPIAGVQSARVSAALRFSEITSSERTTGGEFYVRGRSQRSVQWHRCRITCRSEVVAAEVSYTSQYSDLEEWPCGWPAA
jgi:hypothetical protein